MEDKENAWYMDIDGHYLNDTPTHVKDVTEEDLPHEVKEVFTEIRTAMDEFTKERYEEDMENGDLDDDLTLEEFMADTRVSYALHHDTTGANVWVLGLHDASAYSNPSGYEYAVTGSGIPLGLWES